MRRAKSSEGELVNKIGECQICEATGVNLHTHHWPQDISIEEAELVGEDEEER